MTRALVTAVTVLASPAVTLADVLEVQPVTDDVWVILGPIEQRSAANLANNATFGLVVTPEGAVLIDPGGSWQGATMLHAAVRTSTDQPVVHVLDTGGQDHRRLGNGYWQAQAATVIASAAAVEDHHARVGEHMIALARFLGQGLAGTDLAYADVTYPTDYGLEFGGLSFGIMHRGAAHTPGDIVYVDRLLGNGSARDTDSWIAEFEAMAAFGPTHIVPGHSRATDLATATRDTHDDLVNLHRQIGALIETGGDIMDAPGIDQSAWAHLDQFEALAGRNPQATCEEVEWE